MFSGMKKIYIWKPWKSCPGNIVFHSFLLTIFFCACFSSLCFWEYMIQPMQFFKGMKISIQPNKDLSSLSHCQGGVVPSMIITTELQKLV